MAIFFKNLDELKKKLSVSKAYSIDEWETQESYSIGQYVKDWISQAQIDTLADAYAASPDTPLSDDDAELISHLQMAVAHFTFYEHIPFAEVQIDNSGIFRRENQNQKTAYSGQVLALKRKVLTTAYNALENALEFMESKPGVFTDWESSTAYTKNREYFINTAKDFSDCYGINMSRMVFKNFFPFMREVELFEVEPFIGSDFFAELKTKINAKTALTTKEVNALKYIQCTVANYTIARAVANGWTQYTPDGIVSKELEQTDEAKREVTASAQQVSVKIAAAEQTGERFRGKLLNYLKSNMDDFPTFRDDTEVNPEETDETKFTGSGGVKKSFYFAG